MAISVVMPALEMAQETGKLISWLKKEGETVTKGEPLLEIETDKAVMEIESPGDGVLTGIKIQAGTEVPVGRTIAWIVRPGETPPTDDAPAATGKKTTAPRPTRETPLASSMKGGHELRVSPKARRVAAERGVDLSTVRGTGPEGEILASDILAFSSPGTTDSASVQNVGSIARLMAERTTQSWTTVPHFYVLREVDAGRFKEKREKSAAALVKSGVKLTHTDLLIALVARVLEKHPRLNSSWTPEGIRYNSSINIAIAIAVSEGVVAPVIHHAHQLSLSQIAGQRQDLAERARAGKLRRDDLTGGTFTISNLGMYGVDAFTAIITPPQVAILAVGAITDRVVAVEGIPAVRPMMTLSLSSDHRVVDGARAAGFMNDLVEAIQQPVLPQE
jgi:pyruvate dehydrogenase E2 component (dihydrolipoamide acetyltransferase)